MDFYEPNLYSFSIQPGTASRLSITSTCYSILAILSHPSIYDSMVDFMGDTATEESTKMGKVPFRRILRELLHSEWRQEDLFQTSILLYTLLKADPDRTILFQTTDEITKQRIRQLLSTVLQARTKRRLGSNQAFSDYICFQCCKVYCLLQETTIRNTTTIGNLPADLLPDGAASDLSIALARAAEVSMNELCRQLAYHAAGDTTLFDNVRLAYSLLSYVQATKALAGTAGRRDDVVVVVPTNYNVLEEASTMVDTSKNGSNHGTKPSGSSNMQLNPRLVAAALDVYFQEQRPDGLWDQGQPIYKSFRRQGRNVGNAFVFSVDTVESLLEAMPSPEAFRPHLKKLQNTLEWIETHPAVEVIPDYCDPESGQCYGKPLRGWTSPHLSPGSGPTAWSTAQVLKCVSAMKYTIRKLLHNDVLREFRGVALSQKGPRPAGWNRLLDSDLGNPCGPSGCLTLKSVLDERVCTPFQDSIRSPTSYGAAYSTILFGPPGTAKTTICESLAERMGWDFVVIDTAAFLADGLTNVASRIRYVFTRLMALDKCVILFDEIEEFCLDRETPGLSMESRMLTTAMLTAINDLRRTKRSVFFLATNRLRAFDSAIIRPGRFDLQLFVGTPNLGARVIQFSQALSKAGTTLSEGSQQEAISAYRSFLETVWSTEQDAMFMNFLESQQFATFAAKVVATGGKLEYQALESILKQQAAVMTIRGSVRDEYIASMELSRF